MRSVNLNYLSFHVLVQVLGWLTIKVFNKYLLIEYNLPTKGKSQNQNLLCFMSKDGGSHKRSY